MKSMNFLNFIKKQKKWFISLGIILFVYVGFFIHYQYLKSQILLPKTSENTLWKGEKVQSEIYPIADGHEALIARIALIEKAKESIDLQYYIWHRDKSGLELFSRLKRAADRGVKVRILLDDMDTSGADNLLATLDNHENIEIRLYNAFFYRTLRFPDFLFDFGRVNQRMHNKSFIVDGKIAIVGGRNIGDEYFSLRQNNTNFYDLDVIARGEIASHTKQNFDLYWNANVSTPVSRVISSKKDYIFSNPTDFAAEDIQKIESIISDKITFQNVEMQLFSDSPYKSSDKNLLSEQIFAKIGFPEKNLSIVSPYFIPQKKGIEFFSYLSEKGVKISLLTNAYEATDVGSVHGGYAGSRVPLLKSGVNIFELNKTHDIEESRKKKKFGISQSSLHAKTFSVDGEKIFIGSMNFDPRSIVHNTEMGYILYNENLAKELEKGFESENLPKIAYKLLLDENQNIVWNDTTEKYDTEPGTNIIDRIFLKIIDILPIKWLL